MVEIDFKNIEKKWQEKWEKEKAFSVKEGKTGSAKAKEKKGSAKAEDHQKKKYYVLEMYPYPSAYFLHMGHVRNYTIGDVYARVKRMQGYNVLYPMGYDSFGLPAETAAKKAGIHPKKYAEDSIKKIISYQKALGNSYDWDRTLSSHDVDYYKWNQYFFLKFYEKGIAYRKKAPINWCANCESVLANEEAEGGKCWRCGNEVIKKDMEQWFYKITDYAERLLSDLDKIDWPERIKIMQKNWIGKSNGTEINFEVEQDANFVLLHGFTGSPDSGFFPWLKKELEKRGYKVNVPKLPNTNNPNINEQADYVLKNCKFDENTVLLGHSLGCVIALKVLEKLNKPIKKFISAAGFSKPGFKDKERPFEKQFDGKFNFEKINNNIKEVVILRAENDYAVPKDRADSLKEKISGKIIDFTAKGEHITGKEEPVVLKNCLDIWQIFTTRIDTVYGVTFMVISALHPRLLEITDKKHKCDVEEFVKKCQRAKTQEEIEKLEKDGVFIGKYAINPITNEKIPVYAGNFVLADYGCGMVMAVPAHDQRDFEFAKKYNLPIKVVINPDAYELNEKKMSRAYTSDGRLANSGEFNGWSNREAIDSITESLEKKKLGGFVTNYKIRDWLISRQRYWGTPIPIIYCQNCGVVPVPEKDLPVILPLDVDFKKSASSPLSTNKDFLNVKCPKCKGNAKRETDTMGGFVDSSWYFLRYCDNKNKKCAFDFDKVNYWMPVDQYIGGAEHAVMHLIYARFFTKALKDLGFVKFDEPFSKLFNQGIVYKDGAKMSKSYGNVVFQTDISDKYGIDTARLFLMFVSSPDKQMEWSDDGIEGSHRIIKRLIKQSNNIDNKKDEFEDHKINLTIKKVCENIEKFDYPKAIISIVECIDNFSEGINKKNYETILKLISPFCPHICEELWEKLGNKGFVSLEKWPVCDESKTNEKFEKIENATNNLINDIKNILKILENKNEKKTHIKVFIIPNELELYKGIDEKIEKIFNMKAEVLSIKDAGKTGKEIKAKPGKPGILME